MTITPQSKTTLGLAATIVSVGMGSTWLVARAIGDVKTEVASKVGAIDTSINGIKAEVENRITIAAASEQALRMAIENPGMRVPDPRDPNRIIVVDRARTLSTLSPLGDPQVGPPADS